MTPIQIGDRVIVKRQEDFKFTVAIVETPPELQGDINVALIGKVGTVTDIWTHRIYPDFYKYVVELDGPEEADNRVMLAKWMFERVDEGAV